MEYYESLPYEERMALQDEFGQENIANREVKFYKWIEEKFNL